MSSQNEIEILAEWIHDKYEEASSVRGWNTQKKCKVDFWDLPKENRLVMLDVAANLLMRFNQPLKKDLEHLGNLTVILINRKKTKLKHIASIRLYLDKIKRGFF